MTSQYHIVSEADIRKELLAYCQQFDTFKIAAAKLKITPSQLSLTLKGKVNVIPAKVLKKLKLKARIVYTRPGPAPQELNANQAQSVEDIRHAEDIVTLPAGAGKTLDSRVVAETVADVRGEEGGIQVEVEALPPRSNRVRAERAPKEEQHFDTRERT